MLFFLVRNGESDRAILILESTEYANFKSIYSSGLEQYADKHSVTHNTTLQSTTLVISELTDHTQDRVNFGITAIGLSVFIIIILSVLFGIVVSKKTTNPINRLSIAAKKIADGELDTNIPEEGFHETRELAKSFNKMSISLKKIIELEKKLAIAETQLKSERFAAIGEASSKIAHDLKNPLTAIKSELELFQYFNKSHLDEKSMTRLRSIEESLDLMNDEINGMMNYVKANQLDLETTTVSKLILSVVKIIVKPNNIDIELPKGDFILKCDLQKLSSVLINLINNAIQAIGSQSGTITVTFEETSNHIVIDVIDSGMGIPDDSLEKIFEPLYTTKNTGTGLGLSSCKNIVERHGGIIKAKNNPTTFTIMMPKNPEKQQEKIIQSH